MQTKYVENIATVSPVH